MLITLARKPLNGATVVQCCLQHGCGALNIDASRIGTGTGEVTTVTVPDHRSGNFGQDTQAYKDRPKLTVQRVDQGRWPANVILAGSVNIELARQSGISKSPASYVRTVRSSNQGIYAKGIGEGEGEVAPNFGDTGTAARFFKQIQINKDNDAP